MTGKNNPAGRNAHADIDPQETGEWMDALRAVIDKDGPERAHFLLENMVDFTRRSGGHLPYDATTAYINTIPPHLEARSPGDSELEWRIRSFIRWNAMAIVVRAGKRGGDLGGHIASFASAATLYDVGFNHFFKGNDHPGGGDLVYIQGHSSPGIYARSFLEGRLSGDQLDRFRQEVDGDGLSSYPHPWLMPDYWQLPTVSMGLGPIMAIYQARFLNEYLHNRGIMDTSQRRVWCFLGRWRDGRARIPRRDLPGRTRRPRQPDLCDQLQPAAPRRPGARQRQDHPGTRRRVPRRRLERDQGHLGLLLGSALGQGQGRDCCAAAWKKRSTASTRITRPRAAPTPASTSSANTPSSRRMVADMSDEDIWRLNRGGHDPHKVYTRLPRRGQHRRASPP